ncbi:unnamed protein product [Clonostachys rosea]|uniref:Transcription factor domain-containing protein n=1 Tax=Bionectria ochroleuca TaxID=29856 RepID=A0ABY6UR01_BIOOC|nr:unnamed protein product [Clonostachys rosea]
MEKRKRSEIEPQRLIPAHLPSDSINPFSRSPGQLLQFSFVGLTDTDEDPSEKIPLFPHRGLDHGSSYRLESESDGDNENEYAKRRNDTNKDPSQKERRFLNLLQATQQFIDQDQISRAARAYGLLLQMQPRGYATDVRYYNLWAIGAEILMREGEKPPQSGDEASQRKRRWGSAANMDKVRAYFETLIQQHPYDHKRPRTVCALDFWLALLSCEIYNTYTEQLIALEDADGDVDGIEEEGEHAQPWDMEVGDPSDLADRVSEPMESSILAREDRLARRKDTIRLRALATMKGVAEKMDRLIQDRPYSKNDQFLRLRAMVSLYISDLILPVVPTPYLGMQKAEEERESEQIIARRYLARFRDVGGELDSFSKSILDVEGDNSENIQGPIFSSLPFRTG